MDILGTAASVLGGGTIGSIFGGIFAIVGKLVSLKEQKLKYDHDLLMRQADKEFMIEEARLGIEREGISQEGQTERTLIAARNEAMKSDRRTFSNNVLERWKPDTEWGKAFKSICIWQLVQVDVLRGATRPMGAWLLTALAGWFGYEILDAAGWVKGMDKDQLYALALYIISTIFGLAVMAWTFWFVGRQLDQPNFGNQKRSARKYDDDKKAILNGDSGAVNNIIGELRRDGPNP